MWQQNNEMLFLIVTLGILGEAAIFQVISYTPPDNNIFFHSFAIAYMLVSLMRLLRVDMGRIKMTIIFSIGILFWWSNVYWKYIQRIAEKSLPNKEQGSTSATGENIVNRKTFMIKPLDTTDVPRSEWVFSNAKSFKKISMPASTAAGIDRLLNMQIVKMNKDLKVLNMSELTPLAAEIPYNLEKGSYYHCGITWVLACLISKLKCLKRRL